MSSNDMDDMRSRSETDSSIHEDAQYSKEQLEQIHQAMMEELGIGRKDNLGLEDGEPRGKGSGRRGGHHVSPATIVVPRPKRSGNNPALDAWSTHVFTDTTTEEQQMEDIAGGQLHRIKRSRETPTSGMILSGLRPHSGGLRSGRGGHHGGLSRADRPDRMAVLERLRGAGSKPIQKRPKPAAAASSPRHAPRSVPTTVTNYSNALVSDEDFIASVDGIFGKSAGNVSNTVPSAVPVKPMSWFGRAAAAAAFASKSAAPQVNPAVAAVQPSSSTTADASAHTQPEPASTAWHNATSSSTTVTNSPHPAPRCVPASIANYGKTLASAEDFFASVDGTFGKSTSSIFNGRPASTTVKSTPHIRPKLASAGSQSASTPKPAAPAVRVAGWGNIVGVPMLADPATFLAKMQNEAAFSNSTKVVTETPRVDELDDCAKEADPVEKIQDHVTNPPQTSENVERDNLEEQAHRGDSKAMNILISFDDFSHDGQDTDSTCATGDCHSDLIDLDFQEIFTDNMDEATIAADSEAAVEERNRRYSLEELREYRHAGLDVPEEEAGEWWPHVQAKKTPVSVKKASVPVAIRNSTQVSAKTRPAEENKPEQVTDTTLKRPTPKCPPGLENKRPTAPFFPPGLPIMGVTSSTPSAKGLASSMFAPTTKLTAKSHTKQFLTENQEELGVSQFRQAMMQDGSSPSKQFSATLSEENHIARFGNTSYTGKLDANAAEFRLPKITAPGIVTDISTSDSNVHAKPTIDKSHDTQQAHSSAVANVGVVKPVVGKGLGNSMYANSPTAVAAPIPSPEKIRKERATPARGISVWVADATAPGGFKIVHGIPVENARFPIVEGMGSKGPDDDGHSVAESCASLSGYMPTPGAWKKD